MPLLVRSSLKRKAPEGTQSAAWSSVVPYSPGATTSSATPDSKSPAGVGLSKRTLKRQSDNLVCLQRDAMNSIVQYLEAHPDEVFLVKGALESGHFKNMAKGGDQEEILKDWFHHTYSTLKMVPKYWWVAFFMNHTGASRHTLDAIEKKNASGLRQVAAFMFGVRDSMHWPQRAHRKLLLTQWDRGMRWRDWWQNAVAADGTIDWVNHGPFELVFDGQLVTQVKHISGETAPLVGVAVTNDWDIISPWHDYDASLKFKALNPRIADFFDSVPSACALQDHDALEAEVKEVEATMECSLCEAPTAVQGSHEVLQQAREEAKQRLKSAAAKRRPRRAPASSLALVRR